VSNTTLKNAIEYEFVRFIRQRDSAGSHYCKCFTCRQDFKVEELNCSHFVRLGNSGLKWHPKNVHLACNNCNIVLDGNEEIYHIRIDLKYGPGTADMLKKVSRETNKYTTAELQEILIHFPIVSGLVLLWRHRALVIVPAETEWVSLYQSHHQRNTGVNYLPLK